MSTRVAGRAFSLGVARESALWRRSQRGNVGETQLAAALSASAQPLIIVDAFDRIQVASAGTEALVGTHLRCGSSVWGHLGIAAAADGQTLLQQTLAGTTTLELVLPDQQVKRATLQALLDTHGEATHVSLTFEAPIATAAERALLSVGRLAGALAHDINNQLAAAINNVYVLKRRLQPVDHPVGSHLEELQSAMWRAATLAGSLTNIARRHALQAKPSSLNEILADMAPLLNHLARDFELELRLGAALPQMRAPLTEIEQVIASVVVFSLSRAGKGSVLRLETSTALDTDGRPYVRLLCEICPSTAAKPSNLNPSSRRVDGVLRRAVKRCHSRIRHDAHRAWVDFFNLESLTVTDD